MFETGSQELLRQYGMLVYLLPFLPSFAAAGLACLMVRPGQRRNMLGLSAAAVCCCFGVNAALLPLLEAVLPVALLQWEAPFILLLPPVVIGILALRARGGAALLPPLQRAAMPGAARGRAQAR